MKDENVEDPESTEIKRGYSNLLGYFFVFL